MASSKQKKRPPRIQIPVQLPVRQIVPGPNAFAIADRQAAEAAAQADAEQLHPGFSGESNASPFDGERDLRRLSSKEAYSNLAEGVRRSPTKPKHSQNAASAPSRHGNASPMKYPDRSVRSWVSEQKQYESLCDEATSRKAIEARTERKYQKMIGLVPQTPTKSR